MDLVVDIYTLTKEFPDSERYGLASQIQRAAVSIPSNIAEGAGRNGSKVFIQFLYISLGSLAEVETQLEIAKRLKYAKDTDFLNDNILLIRRLLLGLIKYLKGK